MINVREEGRSDEEQEKTGGISLQSSQNTFSAFPNPVRDILQIRKHSRSENQVYVSLVSAQGVPFFLYSGKNDQMPDSFDISLVPVGYYILSIQSVDANTFIPIIISR